MPIYEYQCEECGVRFDRLQAMSSPPVTTCPECSGMVHRVISSVGVIFKGSGFYVTDNRKSSSGADRRKSKTDVESSGDSASKPAKESESPAAKESKPPAAKESD